MASIFKHERSPFWWVRCRDARPGSKTFGKQIRFSTKYRVGIGTDTRHAETLRAELTLAESKTARVASTEHWADWVPGWLVAHCKSPLTLKRYKSVWGNLAMYLAEKEIVCPKQLTRGHCMDYLAWRLRPDRKRGKWKASNNTAQYELRFLGLLMAEAVRRSYAPLNPASNLGISRQRTAEKPEFTDAHLKILTDAITSEPDGDNKTFLRNSFLIARYQGCRLAETHLNPLTDVDIEAGVIRFRAKGDRIHAAPLHPKLVPLFRELQAAGATETYKQFASPTKRWFDFFKRSGLKAVLPKCCFHSLRVTAASRLARSKVSEAKAMRFLGHSSTVVHRQYVRLRLDDLGDCVDALG